MGVKPASPTPVQTDLYATSAGLDLVSGVLGYLSAQAASSVARSRADLIRVEAQANAQRYSEQAAAHLAQMKVTYLASGVTLAGSPIDVLDTQARVAHENYNAILMRGETDAMDMQIEGANAEAKGRNALLGGFGEASRNLSKGFPTGFGAQVAEATH